MFFFPRVVEEVDSKVNGKIKVYKTFGKYSISVDSLTQSGGLLKNIWKKGLKEIHNSSFIIHNSLVLGHGGGTATRLINKMYPASKITAVEIDPEMIKLSNKYFPKPNKTKILNKDATKAIYDLRSRSYDLILVDLYHGKKSIKINHKQLLSLLREKGIAIYNFLGHNPPKIPHSYSKKILSNTLVFCAHSE